MSVLIRNAQAAVPLHRWRLRRDAELLLRLLLHGANHHSAAPRPPPSPPPSSSPPSSSSPPRRRRRRVLLAALCVSSRRIRSLNHRYRGEDSATDVLAFPYAETEAVGLLPKAEEDGATDLLGDVYLGLSYIQRGLRPGESFHGVLAVTLLHGMCHLLGYTHDTMTDWKQMYEKESEVLLEYARITGIKLTPLTAGTFGSPS